MMTQSGLVVWFLSWVVSILLQWCSMSVLLAGNALTKYSLYIAEERSKGRQEPSTHKCVECCSKTTLNTHVSWCQGRWFDPGLSTFTVHTPPLYVYVCPYENCPFQTNLWQPKGGSFIQNVILRNGWLPIWLNYNYFYVVFCCILLYYIY